LATKPFEAESPARSWFELLSTLVVYGACLTVAVRANFVPLQIFAAVIAGLTQFRLFSLYHDHNHNAFLAKSTWGRRLMTLIGLHLLAPRSVWKETHDFHHWNNGKIEWTAVGSYKVLTVDQFRKLSPKERSQYLWSRNPMYVVLGYITVAITGFCVQAYRRSPKRHYAGPRAIALHVAAFAAMTWGFGLGAGLLSVVVPSFVGHWLSAYLFYVQHNFPETHFYKRGTWEYTAAAVEGSSYLVMGPLMNWFTANIGYHHVHHLNAKIPSYRLPEAMAAIPEMRNPHRTTMKWSDMAACFRLKVWDPESQTMQPAPTID